MFAEQKREAIDDGLEDFDSLVSKYKAYSRSGKPPIRITTFGIKNGGISITGAQDMRLVFKPTHKAFKLPKATWRMQLNLKSQGQHIRLVIIKLAFIQAQIEFGIWGHLKGKKIAAIIPEEGAEITKKVCNII